MTLREFRIEKINGGIRLVCIPYTTNDGYSTFVYGNQRDELVCRFGNVYVAIIDRMSGRIERYEQYDENLHSVDSDLLDAAYEYVYRTPYDRVREKLFLLDGTPSGSNEELPDGWDD